MRSKFAILLMLVSALFATGCILLRSPHVAQAAAAVPAVQDTCDRSCMKNILDEYLVALVKHDDTWLPLANNYKYTENTAQMQLGDGLWVGASEMPTFRIYGIDPVSGQAAIFCVMKEFNKPVLVTIRLRIQGGKITEIEHIVRRDPRPEGLVNLVTPRPGFAEDVPPGERTPRAEMLRIGDEYFDSIVKGNGKLAPFADDCERHENGVQTTTNKVLPAKGPDGGPLNPAMGKLLSLGCEASMNTGAWIYITKIEPRRVLIADEQKGIVFAFPMFYHRGSVHEMKIKGVPGVDSIPINFGPINMEACAIFKIRSGKIHEIEASGFLLPYGSKTGWE
ncbi:MAG: hypothetical protein WA369_07660 [Candidatus Acidiferrales bacterium]